MIGAIVTRKVKTRYHRLNMDGNMLLLLIMAVQSRAGA